MSINSLITSRAVIGEIYMKLTAPAASWVNRYAMRMESSQDVENYAWLGMAPKMREWVAGRQPKGLREQTFAIANKDHEATLEILVKDLRRERWGQIRTRIAELSRRALTYPMSLLSTLMINGEAATCYDGQYFFDTDHSEGDSGAQSNDLSVDISALPVAVHGSVTSPSTEEMAQAILQAVQAILGFKDDQGEPMNEDAAVFEVMVPTSLTNAARAAVGLQVFAGGVSNQIAAQSDWKISVVTNPRLTWTDKFAVYRTDAETKPFILQEEQPVNVSAIAEGSELEFRDKKHWYGVDWAGNVGYGFWQHACLVTMI